MGREVNRVPMNFDWPLNKTWEGFLMPDNLRSKECLHCGGGGLNPDTTQIAEDWYDFSNTGKRWCNDITQDEVQALVDSGRLMDFTRVPRNEEQRLIVKAKIANGGNSWLPTDNGYVPTAEEVNEWAKEGFGHDCINRFICVEARAKRLGVYGECEHCKGQGSIFRDETHKKEHESWGPKALPKGEGWQMWETTSEGSPISPVMKTPEELAAWLANTNASSFAGQGATYEQWMSMIVQGWAPSAILTKGKLMSGVEASNENN